MTRLKSSKPKKLGSGNTTKYLSYKEAWTRIKLAKEEGFYLEAVTLVESIISDRLSSHLHGTKKLKEGSKRPPSFSELISTWRDSVKSQDNVVELATKVDSWRRERNILIHGMVKSMPGTPTQHPEDFLSLAENAATTGEELAKKVCRWHKKELSLAARK
jgi:hypothetical protein